MPNNTCRFYIDEAAFVASNGDQIADAVQTFVTLVDTLKRDGQSIQKHSELYYVEILPGMQLVELLYPSASDTSMLDRLLLQLLREVIDKCPNWDENGLDWTRGAEAANVIAIRDTRSFVRLLITHSKGAACVCLDSDNSRNAVVEVIDLSANYRLYSVAHSSELVAFYRYIIDLEDMDEEQFLSWAPTAFPYLHFVPGRLRFGSFSKQNKETIQLVVENLSVLNDHFTRIHAECAYDHNATTNRISSECSCDMTRESVNTHKKERAMKERDVLVDGFNVRCEWHCKLYPTVDRIHFCPGNPSVCGGKIIVGIFARHLTT